MTQLTIDEIEAELRRRANEAASDASSAEDHETSAYFDGQCFALISAADWIAQQRKEPTMTPEELREWCDRTEAWMADSPHAVDPITALEYAIAVLREQAGEIAALRAFRDAAVPLLKEHCFYEVEENDGTWRFCSECNAPESQLAHDSDCSVAAALALAGGEERG